MVFQRPVSSSVFALTVTFAGCLASGAEVQFNRDVRPILSEKCFQCHGPDAAARKADLRLDSAESTRSVVAPDSQGSSELARRIATSDIEQRMPPQHSNKSLTDSEKSKLLRWIEQGAPYQPHWSLISPRAWPLPEVRDIAWPENSIDYFVLSELEKNGLRPSPPADPGTLIRRVTLDLTGLPPTPDEIGRFTSDASPDAYERLIDRLLGSPRYGEHAASFWLEASRYADTDGYQNDRYRYQHVWRDWVILALNDDKPYDDFVIEQLAGDMLPNATLKQQIATGFCRNHRITSEDGSLPDEWQPEYVADRVDTLGTVFMGMTVACARCHDHKFDPISQKEYYRLFAYFNNVPEWGVGPNNGNSPPFVEVPINWPNLSPDEDRMRIPEPVKLRAAREEAGNGLKRPQAGPATTVMVMHEIPDLRPTYVLSRGQYNAPDKSEKLAPGVPRSFDDNGEPPRNRLELARWLTQRAHPLTARVAVNRYWQQIFGTGLVKTSENFGSQGEPPSHPELLDDLAAEFAGNWDIKLIQKKILMSATYQQTSQGSETERSRDLENRLLSRGPRFRLPAFVLRDQALAISGLLVQQFGGVPVKPYMPADIWNSISNNKYEQGTGSDLYRRSLYTFWRRTISPPTMTGFNAADREVCVMRTERTNTPLQALTLMNNVAFVEASRFLAERILREGGDSITQRLLYGFTLTTGRQPSAEEQSVLVRAHASFEKRFHISESEARQLLTNGERPYDPKLEPRELAAMSMLASLLLNLDETITKE